MVKEARARRVKFERRQREALLRQRAEATLRQAFLMNQQKAAMAIQVYVHPHVRVWGCCGESPGWCTRLLFDVCAM